MVLQDQIETVQVTENALQTPTYSIFMEGMEPDCDQVAEYVIPTDYNHTLTMLSS